MHLKNIYFVNLWLVFCLLFTTACNDDDNIYFTQDEIIGDINSGKQIALENNTLVVYTNNHGYLRKRTRSKREDPRNFVRRKHRARHK